MRRGAALSALLLASCAGGGREYLNRGGIGPVPEIRVLLRSVRAPFDLSVDGPAEIVSGPAASGAHYEDSPAGRVRFEGGRVLWGARRPLEGPVRVRSTRGGTVRIDSVEYPGTLELRPEGGQVIEGLPLEHYLGGVLFAEVLPDWPDAALRAQAIASRSYALYRIRWRELSGSKRAYDVDDTSASQVYHGGAIPPKAWRIVRETAGLILVWQGKLFEAWFHSTCGGHTAPCDLVFDYPRIRPLSGVECPYCRRARYADWSVFLGEASVRRALARRTGPARIELGRIESIEPVPREQGDLYPEYFRVVHDRGRFEIRADALRSALNAGVENPRKPIKSTAIVAVRKADGGLYEFVGHGWGHGVGLCQWGAREMAVRGYSYLEILRHYYPGARLARAW